MKKRGRTVLGVRIGLSGELVSFAQIVIKGYIVKLTAMLSTAVVGRQYLIL